ncbi:MAG: response regulator transcription factor [Ignavibacteriaceae bacterium]|jgi:DNA-binding NarL/FixJ family response regulator
MIKIIVVDDHPMLRAGLVQTISREPDLKVLDECGNGEELISKITGNEYDVVVLDIDLPGRNGIEILKEVKKINPKLSVLILSSFPEERYGVRAIKAGANAYLTKGDDTKIIVETIRGIKGNKRKISPKLAEILANELNDISDKLPHERLSDRELEVMRHIALGKSTSEIAVLLSLSVNTVNTYRARILEKMCFSSNTQIAIYALENGLLDKASRS